MAQQITGRRALIAQLNRSYGECQCTDSAHNGTPCQGRAGRIATAAYFSYICKHCQDDKHGPILAYEREGAFLYGQLADASATTLDPLPDGDWP